MGLRFRFASILLLAAFSLASHAQSGNNTAPLLPASFGAWQHADQAQAPASSLSLVNISKQALEECGPVRSQVADYTRGGHSLHVEAIEFGDRTGAYSAYTLVKRPEMREGTQLGSFDSVGADAVLFTQGASLVLAYPTTAADLGSLKPLADALPKPFGNKNVAPQLPKFVPAKGLVNGTVRYAVGAATYAAQGGVLPANSIGWDKSAEAITADYEGNGGKETLTLLMYPTPEIAGAHQRAIANALPSLGPSFANANVRREMELVMLASGPWSADDAQHMVENIHMKQELSVDKDVQPVFHTEVQKTASLLLNITVLFGILASAAIILGLFFGGGRALVRVMRGKSAAVEPEFLSLHLAAQNKPPVF